MEPVTPIYIGSQTLVEHNGVYSIEHRNASDELVRTETIGNRLDLNFRMLGVDGPTGTLITSKTPGQGA